MPSPLPGIERRTPATSPHRPPTDPPPKTHRKKILPRKEGPQQTHSLSSQAFQNGGVLEVDHVTRHDRSGGPRPWRHRGLGGEGGRSRQEAGSGGVTALATWQLWWHLRCDWPKWRENQEEQRNQFCLLYESAASITLQPVALQLLWNHNSQHCQRGGILGLVVSPQLDSCRAQRYRSNTCAVHFHGRPFMAYNILSIYNHLSQE